MGFCHSDIKAVYHILFEETLERYNEKQKRSERKIDDYYEKICRRKQEKLFYEVIFQIGSKEDMNMQSKEGHLERYLDRERVQPVVERSKALEQAERAYNKKHASHTFYCRE